MVDKRFLNGTLGGKKMGNPIADFPKNAEFARTNILPLFLGMRVDAALAILDAAKEALLHFVRVDFCNPDQAGALKDQSPE